MKSLPAISLLMFALTCPSFAQSGDPVAVQRATATVPSLRSLTKDPDSFELIAVWQTRPRAKKSKAFEVGQYDICYEFRTHNAHGKNSEHGMAVQYWSYKDTEKNGRIDMLGTVHDANSGWTRPCGKKNLDVDITRAVKGK